MHEQQELLEIHDPKRTPPLVEQPIFSVWGSGVECLPAALRDDLVRFIPALLIFVPTTSETPACIKGARGEVVLVLRAATDAPWFGLLSTWVRVYVRGRVRFAGYKDVSPYPTMIAYRGPREDAFVREIGPWGVVEGPWPGRKRKILAWGWNSISALLYSVCGRVSRAFSSAGRGLRLTLSRRER